MPAYDYRCTECETEFEVSRPMGSTDPVVCPECAAAAKKVFSPVGVAFKGSGFHNTDYKPAPKADAPSCPSSSEGGCSGCPAAS